MKTVNFAMFLHSHQPVGNFDKVFEKSCEQCYEPMIELLSEYPEVRLTLHFSGSLLEWVESNRPKLADRIAGMVRSGQVELMGGGYYEPILTMLTEEDRQGQIRLFTEHLAGRYGAKVRGAWLTERVWEQGLTTTLARAGIEYTALDDSHFRSAGVPDGALTGSFITEDQGNTVRVFPGSEYLRYVIPFHDVEKTIEYLGGFATEDGGNVITYADDGEKFGIWPKTYEHVYEKGWLRRWLDALRANAGWIRFVTGSEAIDRFKPRDRVYLPDASYREMMEWSLPAATLRELEDLVEDLKDFGLDQRAARFMRGGTWRSFRVKYPEVSLMYAKMMRASAKVNGLTGAKKAEALRELYRGQCNCAYWHGVFGGLYLPHLRRGVKRPLILAESAADRAGKRGANWQVAETGDFDFDGQGEISLANAEARVTFKPSMGGHVVEYSSTALGLDFVDTLARRREAYHRKVFQAAESPGTAVKSIHEISVLKEKGLEKLLQYDWYPRRAFMEHFLGPSADLDGFARCDYHEMGDFTIEPYTVEVRKSDAESSAVMRREGGVYWDGDRTPVTVEKAATLGKGGGLSMAYGVSSAQAGGVDVRFGIEVNASVVTGGGWGGYYRATSGQTGDLLHPAAMAGETGLELIDESGKFGLDLRVAKPCEAWVFPVQTVSQSESGFERVLQSVAVLLLWPIRLEPGVAWEVGVTYSFRAL